MGREKYEHLTQRRSGSIRPKANDTKSMNVKNTSNSEQRPKPTCLQSLCGIQYFPAYEKLDYDYTLEEKKGKNGRSISSQPLPRIRQRGEHYVDSFNDEPWKCAFGTNEEVGRLLSRTTWFEIPLSL